MLGSALLNALINVLDLLLTIYIWLIIARAILSWVMPYAYHPVTNFLYKVTEPLLRPFRRLIPPISGLDLSPLVVIFMIYFLKEILSRLKIKLSLFF